MRYRLLLGFAIVSIPLSPLPSSATARVGIAFTAGYNVYTMEDMNKELIQPINESLAGTGFLIDEITGGWGYGGGLRLDPAKVCRISLDYERLIATSDLSTFGRSFDVDVPADAFTGTFTYFFPSATRSRFGIGVGMGYYKSAGSVRKDSSGVGAGSEITGNGFGFHGAGTVDVELSPRVHFEGMAGFRYAKTSELSIDGLKPTTSAGDEAEIDWSGALLRGGFTFFLGESPSSTHPHSSHSMAEPGAQQKEMAPRGAISREADPGFYD